jgi:uncharacterized protein (TIGR00369 family)
MVFRQPVSIDALNALSRGTIMERIGIVFTAAGEDWLQATMPVDEGTRQPYGLLHGGASVVLAETLGSCAGNLCVDAGKAGLRGAGDQCQPPARHAIGQRDRHCAPVARGPLDAGMEIRIEDEAGRWSACRGSRWRWWPPALDAGLGSPRGRSARCRECGRTTRGHASAVDVSSTNMAGSAPRASRGRIVSRFSGDAGRRGRAFAQPAFQLGCRQCGGIEVALHAW